MAALDTVRHVLDTLRHGALWVRDGTFGLDTDVRHCLFGLDMAHLGLDMARSGDNRVGRWWGKGGRSW